MTADILHRLHHDHAWTLITAVTLAALGLALTVLAYTAWRPR